MKSMHTDDSGAKLDALRINEPATVSHSIMLTITKFLFVAASLVVAYGAQAQVERSHEERIRALELKVFGQQYLDSTILCQQLEKLNISKGYAVSRLSDSLSKLKAGPDECKKLSYYPAIGCPAWVEEKYRKPYDVAVADLARKTQDIQNFEKQNRGLQCPR
jgi:hypothetical protein